jgi:hypothetical protein
MKVSEVGRFYRIRLTKNGENIGAFRAAISLRPTFDDGLWMTASN